MTVAFKNVAVDVGSHSAGQAEPTIKYANNISVGDVVFIWVACDNSGPNGTKPTVSFSDTHGNTYTILKDQNRTANNNVNDGVYVVVLGSIITSAITANDDVTLSFSPTSANRVWGGVTFTGITSLSLVSSNSSSGSGTTYTSNASGSVAIGNLVLGLSGNEVTNVPAADTDTTNGTWNTYSAATSLAMAGRFSYKITNTATGTQTYDAANGASSDWAAIILELGVPQTVSITPATFTLTPTALSGSTGNTVHSISNVGLTLTPITLTTSVNGNAARALGIVSFTLTPVALTESIGSMSITLGVVSFTLTPIALTKTVGNVSINLTHVSLTLTPQELIITAVPSSRSIIPVSLIFETEALSGFSPIPGASYISFVQITLTPVSISASVGGTVARDINPSIFTLTPVQLSTYVPAPGTGSITSVSINFTPRPLVAVANGSSFSVINPVSLMLMPIVLAHSVGAAPAKSISPVLLQLTATHVFGASGGRIFMWTGTTWATKPLKLWNGSTWSEKQVRIWTGSSWELVNGG